VKWIGAVEHDVGYSPSLELLDKCGAHFCVHGITIILKIECVEYDRCNQLFFLIIYKVYKPLLIGDDMPVNSDGVGAYDTIRDAGRLRIVRRTEGVSTTDFIGRLLSLTKEHLLLS